MLANRVPDVAAQGAESTYQGSNRAGAKAPIRGFE